MPAFEYKTHFEPMGYQEETVGKFMFKQSRSDFGAPLAAEFAGRSQEKVLDPFGKDGWELISTEAVWRVVAQSGNTQTDLAGNGHNVVDGYLFFFKRLLP